MGKYNSKYTRKSTIIVPFAHSPGIIYAPNTDEYVLLHVHNLTDNIKPQCTGCKDGCTTSNGNCTAQVMTEVTGFRYIKNLSDADDITKWSDTIIIDAIGIGDSNIAGQIMEDGSFLGMIRKNEHTLYLVTASNWKDNTTWIVHNDSLLFNELPNNGIEDMFPYKDCKGNWHAIFHNEIPQEDNVVVCGGHGFSEDGMNWIYGGLAFNNIVEYDNGEMYTFSRRERPHLVFDTSDNCTLVALTSSVEYTCDATFTFIQPIKH